MSHIDWVDGASGFVQIGGQSIEYVCYGPQPIQNTTIVMLHEGLGCVRLWRDFPRRVSDATGFGVFAYSRAGYGQSSLDSLPRPLNYMTLEATDVLPDILDAIGLVRGILLGHSDGATIAAIHAGSVSDLRIRGLVLIAPHFFTEEMGLVEIARAKEAFETTDLKSKMAKYHRNPDHTFRGWNDAWLHPDFKKWDVSDVIDHLRIPVLVIQGEGDQYGTLAQINEMEDRVNSPFEKKILSNCRHSPHNDQPDMTLAAITEFTARLERFESESVEVA